MPDPTSLREALLVRQPEAWVSHHLASFGPSYFEAFDAPAIDGHLTRIRALTDNRPVSVEARPAGEPGEWSVEVVGNDAFQFLATLCTLLTVHGLSIVEALVFTSEPPPQPDKGATTGARRPYGPPGSVTRPPLRPSGSRPPAGPDRRRKIVDVFLVRQADPSSPPPDWAAFAEELTTLTRLLHEARYDAVRHRLIRRFVNAIGAARGDDAGAGALDLEIDPEGADFATVVRIRARDGLGLLSIMADALALCGIRIVQADVRTAGDGRVDDTIWVTDRSGRKVASEPRLRELHLSLILIEHFSSRLPHAADPEAALVHFSRFATETMGRPDWATEFTALDQPAVLDALVRILGDSDFLWDEFLRAQPEVVMPIINDPAEWDRTPDPSAAAAELDAAMEAAGEDPEPRRLAIRRFKDRELFRAGLRASLNRSGGPEGFADELTTTAEAVLGAAFRQAISEATGGADGPPVPAVLCGLGKLGGEELGFGSDLELMLIYDDRASADAAPVSDFFDGMVRGLRAVMGVRVGGTFDLDFRLRPYGKGGPPSTALGAFQGYYQAGGPAWGYERQALIRLRVVAGDAALGREVVAWRDRFVFGPEPFDLEGCRRMRELQIRQLVKPGTINAKYSPGGLVDIEYFVQALQITHGGADPTVRRPSTLQALAALEAGAYLPADVARPLRHAYRFLRALIDALRVVRGHAKALTVPPAESEEFILLARRMRYDDPQQLRRTLVQQLEATRERTARPEPFLGPAPGPAGPPPISPSA